MKHTFTIKNILLAMLLLCALPLFSQQETVKIEGTVVDETGEPVIGASIVLKKNNQYGVIADVEGEFTLQIPASLKDTILFQLIGFETVKMAVEDAKKQPLRIVLKEDTALIEEMFADVPKNQMQPNAESLYINKYIFDLKTKEMGHRVIWGSVIGIGSVYVPIANVDYRKHKLVVVGFEDFLIDKAFDHKLLFKLLEDKDFALQYAEKQSEKYSEKKDSIAGYEYVQPTLYRKERSSQYYYNDPEKGITEIYLDSSDSVKYVAERIYVSPECIYVIPLNDFVDMNGRKVGDQRWVRIPYATDKLTSGDYPRQLSDIIYRDNYPAGVDKNKIQVIKYPSGELTYYTTDGYHLLYKNDIIDKGINPKKLKAVNAHFIRSGDTYYLRDKKINKKDIFIEIVCP